MNLGKLINDEVIKSSNLKIDWDYEAGEDWVRILDDKMGIVCMLHTKIKGGFIRECIYTRQFQTWLKELTTELTTDYDTEEWFVNIIELNRDLKEISWNASENAVNPKSFSLNDLYFATI